ncbi:GTP cyclohydrolase I FolE [Patescibacteria group bacterium]|nr:GTP cyclohydrolase I FolE [Patescibacteria group bacterium]
MNPLQVSKVEEGLVRFFGFIGEDPNRNGLKGTPNRITKMFQEVFRGYDEAQKPEITVFENHEDGIRSTGILRDSGYFFSFCEHHMLPFFGTYQFGYIPDELVVGASKIARTVDYYAARLQIAERLCYDVIEEIEKQVHPKGSILIMSARHLCKEMRGVKKFNSPYEVDEVRGYFDKNKDGCKDEFLSRINKGRR